MEPPSGKKFVTLEGRAFQAAVPHLWNELPLQLRAIESVEVFNESTKAFLFEQLFFLLKRVILLLYPQQRT